MPDNRLRVGAHFAQQGREYAIEEGLKNGDLRIRDVVTGDCSLRPLIGLVGDLFAGRAELMNPADAEPHGKIGKPRELKDLDQIAEDDPIRTELARRISYVSAVEGAGATRMTRNALVKVIGNVANSIGDDRPPSHWTVYRWLGDYRSGGQDVRCLIPRYQARGNRQPKITGRPPKEVRIEDREKARIVAGIIESAINTRYLKPGRVSVRSVHGYLQARILDENRYRDPHDRLPIPHISSLYRYIERLDPYDVSRARYGKRYADEKYRNNQLGPRTSHPLQRTELDHTKLDLMVVDLETRLPLGRPWLTTLIDVYSRLVLGMYLGFHPPGYLSVMQCLRHAIKPKTYLKELYPLVENPWPAWGLPELIVVDNGKEFHSTSFEDACCQLGIKVDYAPPKSGWYKGAVERWFGTQNKSLLHELPGTTFSNIFERGDYDSAKHAVISLPAMLELAHTWIVDIYHQQEHRGIRDTPHHKWTQAAGDWPPNLPRNCAQLDILLGCMARRRVSRSGIGLFALQYNNPDLGLMRRALGKGEKAS
ncbi:MAG: DDE-type integrase/transposase/recombinase, partial [Blastocatellia bacterium]